jgi:hypothetical protein
MVDDTAAIPAFDALSQRHTYRGDFNHRMKAVAGLHWWRNKVTKEFEAWP